MTRSQPHYRELHYRPQAAKTLRHALIRFIRQEFPRLGGPWLVELFVDKLLQLVQTHSVSSQRLQLGQVLWLAVAVEEQPACRKPMSETCLVPVVLTLASQEDVAALRSRKQRKQVLQQALARVAQEAYTQGGVLTCSDLGLLFQRAESYIARLIREYEAETGATIPRRGNIHDMGPTVSHKAIICYKAFVEGKTTPIIARETFHSPAAVDRYLLDFARVHFAVVRRGMSPEQAAFAIQLHINVVQQYIQLIEQFDLTGQRVYDRASIQISMCD
jgi:hypothetical protein